MRTTQEDEFKFELEFEKFDDDDDDDDEDEDEGMAIKNKVAFIKTLNILLEEAVKDGGDAGGAYHQNLDELKETTDALLREVGLDDEYEAIITKDYTHWSLVKAVVKMGF